jgi:hypothetical protein
VHKFSEIQCLNRTLCNFLTPGAEQSSEDITIVCVVSLFCGAHHERMEVDREREPSELESA